MRRREFIRLAGGAAVAWPFAVRAQQPAVPVVGFVHILSHEKCPTLRACLPTRSQGTRFRRRSKLGRRISVGGRHYERLPDLIAELVRRNVAVLAATGGQPSPEVAKAATQTIPIVFTTNGDPVKEGLVASLSRPDGNATGVTIFGPPAVAKRLQLLHELVPEAVAIAYLSNPNNPNATLELSAAQEAAHSLGINLHVLRASNDTEIESAFAAMSQQKVGALLGPRILFCLGDAPRLFRWRHVIGYQQHTICGNSLRLVV